MNHNYARQRYEIIDECLKNRFKKWNIQSLLVKVNEYLLEELGTKGIKERQLRDDLRVMKSDPPIGFAAPIICDRATSFYSYSDSNYSISKSPLAENDLKKLNEALMILKQFENLPQFQDMKDLILKLESKSGTKKREIEDVISFDNQKNVIGNQWLDFLYRSIIEKRALLIEYKPFTHEQSNKLEVHPYHLKEFNSRWFLFGKAIPKNQIVNLALDRIQSIEEADQKYILNTEIDFENYFGDIIGVTLHDKKKKEKIKLEFQVGRGNYIKTKPLHKSQVIVKETQLKLVIEIKVIPNKELLTVLKSFGRDVKVISPKSIVNELKNELRATLNNYK